MNKTTVKMAAAEIEALFVGISFELFEYLQGMLKQSGISVSYAVGITEGARLFVGHPYHLLLMELPEGSRESRTQLLKALRQTRTAPILLLTGTESSEESIAEVIDCGVDICVPDTLPHYLIGTCVLSMIRRYTDYNRQDCPGHIEHIPLRRGDIYIDLIRCAVEVCGRPVALRPREFALLHYFMRHPGIVLTAEQICAGAWNLEDGYGGDVSGPVSILRRAIEPNPQEPVYIETVHQFGYRFTGRSVETCGE